MKILITICARGGSKGIPHKNIKQLAGKPLLDYTISISKKFKNKYANVDIALSTDSQEIIDVSKLSGLDVPYRRPDFLASDTAGKIDAIKDVLLFYENLNKKKYDFVLDLDVTSPLRSLGDLSEALKILVDDDSAYNLFSVNPCNRNPYFNMVEQGHDGYFHLSKQLDDNILSRQSAPKVYDLNASFYFYKRKFFDMDFKSAITDRSLIYEIKHICFDLDHPLDFEFLSYLVLNNKIDFDWL